MSDPTFVNSRHPPHGADADASPRQRWPHRKPLALAASCIAIAALVVLGWQTLTASSPTAVLERSVAAGATGLGPSAGVKPAPIAPVASASSADSGPTEPAADEVPAAIARQLAELVASHERLAQQSQETDQRLDRIEADVTELRQQFEKTLAAHAKVKRHTSALARQLRLAQAAATQAQAVRQQPKVLGVDTWNGRPSVSMRVGAEVRFFSEGDVVANALVRKADPTTQRVEFVNVSSAAVAASAAAGEAR